ncbi:MAG: JAB domain-containing protein [Reichenbachiella sp.]|uniref:JAB domain-containing protein n=1 Tax=Reichenbachiella sp. TaxID=2184521 RepID=UPI0032980EF2
MNVRLAKDQKIKVLNTQDIWQVMQQVLLRENKIRRNQEHFWIVGLDNSQKILFIELIGLGAVNRVNANPPDVFRMGIYKLAVRMILVHNHPSGTLELSNDDPQLHGSYDQSRSADQYRSDRPPGDHRRTLQKLR